MNNDILNKVIVIGGDHYNTLWTVRSLGIKHIRPEVIIFSDASKSFVQKTKYASSSKIFSQKEQIVDYLLSTYSSAEVKPIIITCADNIAAFLDMQYEHLSKFFYLPNISHKEGEIYRWMDKHMMCEQAKASGFNVPEIFSITTDVEDVQLPEDIVYPCIIKPEASADGSKHDFKICNDEVSLLLSLRNMSKFNNKILVQEYIKPDFEISILGVRLENSKENVIGGMLHKIGTCSSIYNLGMPTYNQLKPTLVPYIDINAVNDFFQKVDYSGPYSIEYFIKDGKAYFLEVNWRTDGDMYVYTTAGINIPYLWVCDLLNVPIDKEQKKVMKDTYGMTEISYVKYLNLSKLKYVLRDLKRCDCFSIFDKRDIKPFIYKFIYALI